ncbi:MAG: hypothetical protein Q7N50_02540 [Armatimonadota bacterium]|nr:hypothetical protein [Armatimonadota bacterium]
MPNPFADLTSDLKGPAGGGNPFADLTGDIGAAKPRGFLWDTPPIEGAGGEGTSEASQTAAHLATSFVATPAAGLAGLARFGKGLLTGQGFQGSMESAGKTMGNVQEALTVPLPNTETAAMMTRAANKPFELIHKYAGEVPGDWALSITKSPKFAALLATAGELAAYSLIGKVAQGKKTYDAAKLTSEFNKSADGVMADLGPEVAPAPPKAEVAPIPGEGFVSGKNISHFGDEPPVREAAAPYLGENIPGGPSPEAAWEKYGTDVADRVQRGYLGDVTQEGQPKPFIAPQVEEYAGPWKPAPKELAPPSSSTGGNPFGDLTADIKPPARGELFPDQKPAFRLSSEEAPAPAGTFAPAPAEQPLLTGTEKAYKDVGMGIKEPPPAKADLMEQVDSLRSILPEFERGKRLWSQDSREVIGNTSNGYPSWFKEVFRSDTAKDVTAAIDKYKKVGDAGLTKKETRIIASVNDLAMDSAKRGVDIGQEYWRDALSNQRGGSQLIGDVSKASRDKFLRMREAGLEFIAPARNAPPALQDLLLREAGLKDVMQLDSRRFWNEGIRKAVPDALDRQAMGLYIELKGDTAKARGYLPDIAARNPGLAKGLSQVIDRMGTLSPEARSIADGVVRQHFDTMHRAGVNEGLIDTYYRDYLTHIYKKTPVSDKVAPVGSGKALSTSLLYAKERTFGNYLEAASRGYEPHSLDIADIGPVYDAAVSKAVYHSRLVNELRNLGLLTNGETPVGWKFTNKLIPGEGPISVHPDAYHIVRQFIDTNPMRDFQVFRSFVKTSQTIKQMILSLSPFHYWNLAKNYILTFDPRYQSNPLAALKKGGDVWHHDPATTNFWVSNGLKVGADSSMEAFQNLTRATIGAKEPGAWQGLKDRTYGLYKGSQHMLWDEFVPSIKIANAELEMALRMKRNPSLDRTAAAKSIAEVMNRKYGLLNWDAMGTTPIAKDFISSILLAPDWTTSNILYGRSAFKGGIEGASARKDWALMVLEWQVMLNGLNYAFSDHTAFENPSGKKFYLELPWRTSDNRKQYGEVLQPGSLRDISRLASAAGDLTEASRFASGKLAPFPKAIYELVANRDWTGEPIMDPYASVATQLKQAAAHTARLPMPIPVQAAAGYAMGDKSGVQSIAGATGIGAVSKGPSKFALEQKAKSALKRGDTEAMQETMRDAQHEGQMLNLKRLMRSEVFQQMKKAQKAGRSPYPILYRATH